MNKNTQTLVIAGVIALAVIGGAWFLSTNGFLGSSSEQTGEVVARVNGEEITQEDVDALSFQIAAQQGFDMSLFDAETQAQFESGVIEELVAQELLRQAAEDANVTVTNEEVETQLQTIIAQAGGEEAYQEALTAENLTEEEVRNEIREGLRVNAYLAEELNLDSVTATETEIEAFYTEVAAMDETTPPLSEIRDQVEGAVIQQKQQALLAEHVDTLRGNAEVEVLI